MVVLAMRGRKRSFSVELSPTQRADLERWQRSTTVSVGLARRARVVLLLADGRSLKDAARIAGLTVRNARKWVRRFLTLGVDGLHDQPGRGRKPVFSPLGRAAPG
jgi:DNA-directed RNA polymerase specialized sigma24 family protein